MKIYSWNVNGIRAVLKKGLFLPFLEAHRPDILCLQETKAERGQFEIDLPDYREYWNSAVKKGYSGTAIFSKQEPLGVINAAATYFVNRANANLVGYVDLLNMVARLLMRGATAPVWSMPQSVL